MPNIAQQDYIIIDWEGKDKTDAAKKAEVDAKLKNIYLTNPLALLSVVFINYYPNDFDEVYSQITCFWLLEGVVSFSVVTDYTGSTETYSFSTV